ncbi:MAG: DUF6666 family protein [Aureliella sp.]
MEFLRLSTVFLTAVLAIANVSCSLADQPQLLTQAISQSESQVIGECSDGCFGSEASILNGEIDTLRPYSSVFDELTLFAGIDGTKQPQEFGVNAHVGGQGSMNWGIPLIKDWGIGLQLGTGITATANAVRVYEILGESTGRTQSYTTLGLFQRTDSGFAWGFVHDFLSEDYYDEFSLSQWRIRGSYFLNTQHEVGMTTMLGSRGDTGLFNNSIAVQLDPIDQVNFYFRKYWSTGAQTTLWTGLAQGHGENNAVTGRSPPKDEEFLFGADVLMPLSANLALYGETNMIMPTDTGTVDAFLGIQWYPTGRAFQARRGKFSPLMSLASPVSFAVDLRQ